MSDTPQPQPDPLERPRLFVVLATIVINVTVVGLLMFAPWSDWRTGLVLNLFDNAGTALATETVAGTTAAGTATPRSR